MVFPRAAVNKGSLSSHPIMTDPLHVEQEAVDWDPIFFPNAAGTNVGATFHREGPCWAAWSHDGALKTSIVTFGFCNVFTVNAVSLRLYVSGWSGATSIVTFRSAYVPFPMPPRLCAFMYVAGPAQRQS